MATSDLTRLTITWSKETDLALRSYLGSQGMKKGALSEFIEDAVRWRLFDRTVAAIKDRNADSDPAALMDLIDTTVREVRSEMVKASGSHPGRPHPSPPSPGRSPPRRSHRGAAGATR
jgi:Ribbon-helix-helix domain